jgi:DNA-binding response OmpR family regulator
METDSLAGRSVLIVEDEALIALDIALEFEKVGAFVLTAHSLAQASELVERDDLAAAVMDFGLGDGDADALCARLKRRGIPFVLHSGYSHLRSGCNGGVVVPKPANPSTLIAAISQMLTLRLH